MSRRIFPATLWVGSPVGLETRASLNCKAVSGLTTSLISLLPRSFFSTAFHCAMFFGVNNSLTVWPGSMVMSTTMASPPNSFWYATLSL